LLEKNFIKLIRNNIPFYNFIRIETVTQNGFPDLLCIGSKMDTILMEVKVAKGNKINLSSHQISTNLRLWNMKQGLNYIIVYVPKYANNLPPNNIYLYEGRKTKELALKGVNEPPTANNWHTIYSYLLKVHEQRTTKSLEISQK
tara:strand:+ start:734 stop:1165 length:432 start_codon:yes stop_codon:yes gene_type:complete